MTEKAQEVVETFAYDVMTTAIAVNAIERLANHLTTREKEALQKVLDRQTAYLDSRSRDITKVYANLYQEEAEDDSG